MEKQEILEAAAALGGRAGGLIAAALKAGVEPVKIARADAGDNSTIPLSAANASRHGLSVAGVEPVGGTTHVMACVPVLYYAGAPAGTHDGLRDGEQRGAKRGGPFRVYYKAAELDAAGVQWRQA